MVKRLRAEGYWVRGADLKHTEYSPLEANDFVVADLRLRESWEAILDEGIDEVYQFAADMGAAGYIFTAENDAQVMHNSAMINLRAADFAARRKVQEIFYSSSACMYPAYNQEDPDNPKCAEETVYPAAPDSEYGWDKLFRPVNIGSEEMFTINQMAEMIMKIAGKKTLHRAHSWTNRRARQEFR
jgi:nucleoside-diphosphate-sugar epimerase